MIKRFWFNIRLFFAPVHIEDVDGARIHFKTVDDKRVQVGVEWVS